MSDDYCESGCCAQCADAAASSESPEKSKFDVGAGAREVVARAGINVNGVPRDADRKIIRLGWQLITEIWGLTMADTTNRDQLITAIDAEIRSQKGIDLPDRYSDWIDTAALADAALAALRPIIAAEAVKAIRCARKTGTPVIGVKRASDIATDIASRICGGQENQ